MYSFGCFVTNSPFIFNNKFKLFKLDVKSINFLIDFLNFKFVSPSKFFVSTKQL